MTQILAAGTTQAASSEFTLAATDEVSIFLKSAGGATLPSDAQAFVQIKSDDSPALWTTIGELNQREPALVLDAPGTFRVQRQAVSVAIGIDKV
jgi:hypothetical protein